MNPVTPTEPLAPHKGFDTKPGTLKEAEHKCLLDALHWTKGSPYKAARVMNIGPATIYRMITKHGIDLDGIRKAYGK